VKLRITINMTTLDLLAAGQRAVIDDIDTGAGDTTLLRLREMGLVPSTAVSVTRRAPWGDPIEVEVRGTRLVLRKEQARCFRVTVQP
jgi:Fe2+ transport system protein FeoA